VPARAAGEMVGLAVGCRRHVGLPRDSRSDRPLGGGLAT